MPSSRKKSTAVPHNAAELAHMARSNPYLQRLIDDAQLRENLRSAVDHSKSAYERLSNGKAPAKAILQDKKLQKEVREAFESIRDAANALQEGPKKQARKGLTVGRALLIAGLGTGLALATSEKLRSKLLDTLFGAEEEFQYTPPAESNPSTPPTTPVSAA